MGTLSSTHSDSVTLVIAYDADEGLFNAITDVVHKALSPGTYACHLCALTHGTLGMLRPWRQYLSGLDHPVAFYHRRAFHARYGGSDLALPVILADHAGGLEILVSASEIERCGSVEELMARLDAALERLTP